LLFKNPFHNFFGFQWLNVQAQVWNILQLLKTITTKSDVSIVKRGVLFSHRKMLSGVVCQLRLEKWVMGKDPNDIATALHACKLHLCTQYLLVFLSFRTMMSSSFFGHLFLTAAISGGVISERHFGRISRPPHHWAVGPKPWRPETKKPNKPAISWGEKTPKNIPVFCRAFGGIKCSGV